MNLKKFLGSLLPSFSRATLLEDLAATREELRDDTLPGLKSYVDAFGHKNFTDKWVVEFDRLFKKETGIKYSGNFIVGIYETLENVSKNLDVIESLIAKSFSSDVTREAISLVQANLIQYLETTAFVTSFSRRVVLASISMEIESLTPSTEDQRELPTAGEMGELEKYRDSFFSAIGILSAKKETVEESFKNIPEVMVNSTSIDYSMATATTEQLDPLHFGLIPLVIHPIYHLRLMKADWQIRRYKKAKEEKQMLQFKLLRLKLAAEKKTDAGLEGMISRTQARIENLSYEMREMESAHGAAA